MKRAKESAPKGRPATLSRVNSELHRGARQEKGSALLQCPVRIPETAENVQDASYTLDGAKTHALLRGIIDSTIDAIWAVDPVNFGLLTWNRSWEQFFLAERGIVLKAGMGRQELWPPGSESIRTWNDFYERALAEGSYTTEYAVSTGTRVLQLSFNLVQPGWSHIRDIRLRQGYHRKEENGKRPPAVGRKVPDDIYVKPGCPRIF